MKKKHVVEIDYVEISGEVNFSIESGVEYKLVNPNGGKVLDVEDGSYNVRTWDGSDVTLSQRWRMTDVGDGKYSVKNTNSGKYLTVDGDLTAPWVNVNLQAWNGTDAQKWSIEKVSNKYYKLINVANGKALDVDGASIDRGANIGTWEDLPSGPAQMWLFYPLD
nr:RICIN domain-containing protein [Gracilibacillus dipsosauri]